MRLPHPYRRRDCLAGRPPGRARPRWLTCAVTNTGAGPEAYFLDARLSTTADYSPLPWKVDNRTLLPIAEPVYCPDRCPGRALDGTTRSRWNSTRTAIRLRLGRRRLGEHHRDRRTVDVRVVGNGGLRGSGPTTTHHPQAPRPSTRSSPPRHSTRRSSRRPPASVAVGGRTRLRRPHRRGRRPARADGHHPGTDHPERPTGTVITGTLDIDDESPFDLLGGFEPLANTVATLPYNYTVG